MTALVRGIEVMEVSALYTEFGKLAKSYVNDDNPLYPLTQIIPASAKFYLIAPLNRVMLASQMMRKLAGRRKMRTIYVDKDEIRYPIFGPTNEVIVMFA